MFFQPERLAEGESFLRAEFSRRVREGRGIIKLEKICYLISERGRMLSL